MNNPHRFIVVEGPIGVGKTSLARRIGESFNCELLLENAEENPFLERFYRDGQRAALPTQLYFLMQRSRQMQALRQADLFSSMRVADYLLEKDRLFAEATLDSDELWLYEQIYEQLTLEAPVPDLVIYLQAPADVLMERIRKRGHEYERPMDMAYLQRLSEAYTRLFHNYAAAPVLIVNAAEIDLVDNEQDYAQLLDQIRETRSGRHYFNPLSLELQRGV